MKKFLSVVMAILIVISITACGSTSEEKKADSDVQMPMEQQVGGTEKENEENNDSKVESEMGLDEEQPDHEDSLDQIEQDEKEELAETPAPKEEEEKSFSLQGTIEETVLLDEKGITITATELTYGKNRAELAFLLENNTEQDLRFMAGTWGYCCNYINGYMVETGSISTTIPAGKKARDTMYFNYEELSLYGIKNIAEIGVGFYIDDADSYKDYLQTEPLLIKTSIADSYDYSTEAFSAKDALNKNGIVEYYTEEELYRNGDVSISSATFWTSKNGDQYVFLEVENDSDETINIVTGGISVDDIEVCHGNWSSTWACAGKSAIIDIEVSALIDDQEYSLMNLTQYAEVSLEVSIEDTDGEEIDSEAIQLSISEKDKWTPKEDALVFEGNGVTVYSLGLAEDEFSLSDDIHLFLLIKNSTDGSIRVDIKDGSLAIDGFIIDEITFGTYIHQGKYGVLDVEMMSDSLEKNEIANIENISAIEVTLEIQNENYRTFVQPTLMLEV